MARVLQLTCRECGEKSIITHTDKAHPDFYTLYCACKNKQCEHKWVSHLTYSHTTKAANTSKFGLFSALLAELPQTDLENIQQIINQRIENKK